MRLVKVVSYGTDRHGDAWRYAYCRRGPPPLSLHFPSSLSPLAQKMSLQVQGQVQARELRVRTKVGG